MANPPVADQVPIRDVHVAAHLRRVLNPDQSPKFLYCGEATKNGRAVSFFERHPELWTEIDAYEAIVSEHKAFRSGKSSYMPSLRSRG